MNTLTEEIARDAGMDAGNRSMYAHGRREWNDEDCEQATKEFIRLMNICELSPTNKMDERERGQ